VQTWLAAACALLAACASPDGGPEPPLLPADVLLVTGGGVGPDHVFVLTAREHIADYGFTTQMIDARSLAAHSSVLDREPFRVIVVSDYEIWVDHPAVRESLTAYCQAEGCGIVFLYLGDNLTTTFGVTTSERNPVATQAIGDPTWLDLIRPTVAGEPMPGSIPDWGVVLTPSGDSIAMTQTTFVGTGGSVGSTPSGPSVLGLEATADRPRTVLIGHDYYDHWFNRLLMHDVLSWVSHGALSVDKQRMIAIDIDDVFQPNWNPDGNLRTVKLQAADVDELVALEGRLGAKITGGFRFTLGFNSGFFEMVFDHSGDFDDAAGDRHLVERRADFDWFDHLPMHDAVVGLSEPEIAALIAQSKVWADSVGITTVPYAVSPAHQGIADRYEPLFVAWHDAGILTTSTTDAPEAFEFLGVSVAHRMNCGPPCYSDQVWFTDVPAAEIDNQIRSVLLPDALRGRTQIFMTHQQGYSRDRITAYTFETYLDFMTRWTTIEFSTDRVDRVVEHALQPVKDAHKL
jgi:hypothetical protein